MAFVNVFEHCSHASSGEANLPARTSVATWLSEFAHESKLFLAFLGSNSALADRRKCKPCLWKELLKLKFCPAAIGSPLKRRSTGN